MIELHDVCNMPKHKGYCWEDVIRKDPKYIQWLLQNLENFTLSNAAYDLYKKSCDVFGIDPDDAGLPPDAASVW